MKDTKAKKAIQILEERKLGESIEWLLSYSSSTISDVPGVDVHLRESDHLIFSYGGKKYELLYENLSASALPDDDGLSFGDFRLLVDDGEMLATSFCQRSFDDYSENSLMMGSIERVVMRDWIEVIPELVAKAKEIKRDQEQKREDEAAKKLDENIDLGDY